MVEICWKMPSNIQSDSFDRYAIYIGKSLIEYKQTCDGSQAEIIREKCCKIPMFIFW